MLYPTQKKKKVPMAYSGMSLDSYQGGANMSNLTGEALYKPALSNLTKGANARISSNISNYKAPTSQGLGAGTKMTGAGAASAVGSAVQGVTEIAGHIKAAGVNTQALIAEDDDRIAYGAKPNVGKTVGKSALSGAAAGAAIGSVVPGIGTVIGGAVGAVAGAAAGYFGGKKKQNKYYRDMRTRQIALNKRRDEESRAIFNTATYAEGGVIDSASADPSVESAVILGGKLHDEGGNPIVDSKTGEKKFETEREEILFSEDQSKSIESYISRYDQTRDERHLIDLGKTVKQIILTQTKDNSGIYDLSKA